MPDDPTTYPPEDAPQGHAYLGEFPGWCECEAWCNTATEYENHITDRYGDLTVGDRIVIADRWPATVLRFSIGSEDDVVVEWTGRRPDFSQTRSTVSRRQLDAMNYTIEVLV